MEQRDHTKVSNWNRKSSVTGGYASVRVSIGVRTTNRCVNVKKSCWDTLSQERSKGTISRLKELGEHISIEPISQRRGKSSPKELFKFPNKYNTNS